MTLLSPDRRELLLHIPKTGGSARRRYFVAKRWYELNYKPQHHRLCDLPRIFGIDIESLRRVYCVIRNPWNRELSHWAHANQAKHDGLGKRAARQHATVNTFVRDWRGTPLWYYERGWHNELYQHTADGTWDEYAEADAYRYWVMKRDGTIPDNVVFIPLERQDDVLSEYMKEHIHIPVFNTSNHGTAEEAFDEDGDRAVRSLYWWSLEHHKEACDAN